jgi:hypothetical protein
VPLPPQLNPALEPKVPTNNVLPPSQLPSTDLAVGTDEADIQNQIENIRIKQNIATDPKGGDKSLEGGAEAIEGLMNKSIMDYIDNIRGTSPEQAKTLEKYKEEFADATGLDVSGKPDTKDALVAFGLALMQNKAGKGFNVGNMLKSVGSAGEKAMPLLQKAKADAKAVALSAGKYALEMRSADTAKDKAAAEKAMNRQKYYIYEKGPSGSQFEKFDYGEEVFLNPLELNKLIQDKNFADRYEFIDANARFDILKERAKVVDPGDEWIKDLKNVSLIGGDPEDLPSALKVAGYGADPNYKGKSTTRYKLGEEKESVVRRFVDFQNQVNKSEKMLGELIENIKTGISIPEQLISKVKQIGISFGMDVDTSSVSKAKQSLANVAIDNVLRILKESGRTISEGERKRAEERVGKIDMSLAGSDPELVLRQVEYVYNMVVTGAQKDLDNAIAGFEENFGFSITPNQSDIPSQEELDALNAANGTNFTMDDFK